MPLMMTRGNDVRGIAPERERAAVLFGASRTLVSILRSYLGSDNETEQIGQGGEDVNSSLTSY